MILIHFTPSGMKRIADLQHTFHGSTAILVGGSPSLREQPLHLIQQRGVVTMAINNSALHFRPTMWVSGDRPECYEPRILMDGTIMKFAPVLYEGNKLETLDNRQYRTVPNIYFYIQEDGIPWDEYLAKRQGVPWYSNTLFVGIHILYQLGFKRIILAGSDFGFGKDGAQYAHDAQLGDPEKKWNQDLYNSQVREMRMLKPVFERAGLTIMDCSKHSRLAQTYKHISMEDAVALCLKDFPSKPVAPSALPHCSKFASEGIQQRIANWPGHQTVQSLVPETFDRVYDARDPSEGQELQSVI